MVLLGHLAAFALSSWLLLHWCRQIAAVDRSLGLLVQWGVLTRLVLGGMLFWTSYLDWPPLQHLHSADGFWQLAPDARSYFLLAANAAQAGLAAIEPGSPSPTYIGVLALWMRVVGATPTAAVLLNTLLAVGACRLLVGAFVGRGEAIPKASRLAIAGLALSPAMVMFAVQGLKDQLVATMLVVAAVGAVRWLEPSTESGAGTKSVGGFALTAIAVLTIAGVRAYLCVILVGALAVALAWRLPQTGRPLREVLLGGASLATLWLCLIVGAGVYYAPYGAMLGRMVPDGVWARLPDALASLITGGVSGSAATGFSVGEAVEEARAGFVRTPGATNLAEPEHEPGSRLERLARGLGATLLPITLLKSVGLVEFSGGRSLLVITDLDTMVNLTLTIGVLVLMAPSARTVMRLPYLVYATTFALGVLLPLAYTVTNFGTLFRLRLMAFTLLWLIALALASGPPRPARNRQAS